MHRGRIDGGKIDGKKNLCSSEIVVENKILERDNYIQCDESLGEETKS